MSCTLLSSGSITPSLIVQLGQAWSRDILTSNSIGLGWGLVLWHLVGLLGAYWV